MIRAICAACKFVFMAPAVLGQNIRCPHCKGERIHVAVKEQP